MRLYTLFALLFSSTCLFAQSLVVKPYLQNAEPTSIHIMWETSSNNSSTVEYGLTSALGSSTNGTAFTGLAPSYIHDVQLTGLQPATKYYYKAVTGSTESDVYFFKTPPLKSSNASFNLVAMSDMQQDWLRPNVFSDIINDNLIPYIGQKFGNDLATDIGYFFVPGDLVDLGSNYFSWGNTFFEPAEDLLSYVPVYPILGNHEYNTPYYFKYFNLPLNGTNTNDYAEHWWYKDYSNVRLIGLESNTGYRVQAQLDWLQTVLDDAATDDDIDFVFAQIHHPYKSELWVDGNLDYTGDVIPILEDFTTETGKPSTHFFGHTHGYSRGQSKDHNHLMVNVATAGGAIDNWGEYENQQDYAEFTRSDDDFGYVLLEVEAGEDPQFLLTRLSHGSYEDGLVTNVLKDSIRIKFNNPSPEQPTGIFPGPNDELNSECIIFLGSEFYDPDGDLHGATQWQIAIDPNFNTVVYDEWYQHENWYNDVDLMAGNNMVDQEVTVLGVYTSYYWRVRYRDRSLAWSEWSEPINFHTVGSSLTGNLLVNGGAEDGTNNWVEDQGHFESISSGQCSGNNSHSGSRLFAVGGVCSSASYSEGHQNVDVTPYQASINTDNATVEYGGYLSDYNGTDRPEFKLEFFGAGTIPISTTSTHGNQSSGWTYMHKTDVIPYGTQTIRMILKGTRNGFGADNDSYFDDMFVKVNQGGFGCEQFIPVGINEPAITKEVKVYPNPTSDVATIEILKPNRNTRYELKLFDRTGRIILTDNSPLGRFRINAGNLASGLYFYQLRGGQWQTSGKLVVD